MEQIVYTFRSYRPIEFKLTTLIITCKRNDDELQCFTVRLEDIAANVSELLSHMVIPTKILLRLNPLGLSGEPKV